MNTIKKLLRLWLSLASIGGFLGGWAIIANLAEVSEPETASSETSITIELPAIPQIDQLVGNTSPQVGAVQTFTLNTQPSTASAPPMRTGGS